MAETVEVIAILKMKPECVEVARPHVTKLIEMTRQEKGNIRYDFYSDLKEPTTFVCIERYTDLAAVEAHKNSEHFKAVAQYFPEWLSAPEEIRVLKSENVAEK